MKTSRLFVYILSAFILFLLCLCIAIVRNKPHYRLKLISSFIISELSHSDDDKVYFPASDTTLYVYDRQNMKSYAYSFDGRRDNTFQLPADSIFYHAGMSYLPFRNQLCIDHWDKKVFDFYTPSGKPIDFSHYNYPYVSYAEWQDTLYYTIWHRNRTMGMYKEVLGKDAELLKLLPYSDIFTTHSVFFFRLMAESNGRNALTLLDTETHRINITFITPKEVRAFHIWRNPPFVPADYHWDAPWDIFAGLNYIVLRTKGPKDDGTDKIYNLHGNCLGKLECDDKNSYLVEISGDKLFFFNKTTGRIRVYTIKV